MATRVRWKILEINLEIIGPTRVARAPNPRRSSKESDLISPRHNRSKHSGVRVRY